MEKHIVKVQISFNTPKEILIYNESHDIWYQMPATKKMLKLLDHKYKSYWSATYQEDGMLELNHPVKEQSW